MKIPLINTEPWTLRAACAHPHIDPDTFFRDTAKDRQTAKTICATCPAQQHCYQYAQRSAATDQWGIWGGNTSQERQDHRRRTQTHEPNKQHRTHCHRGHNYNIAGRTSDGKSCRQCYRDRKREAKHREKQQHRKGTA